MTDIRTNLPNPYFERTLHWLQAVFWPSRWHSNGSLRCLVCNLLTKGGLRGWPRAGLLKQSLFRNYRKVQNVSSSHVEHVENVSLYHSRPPPSAELDREAIITLTSLHLFPWFGKISWQSHWVIFDSKNSNLFSHSCAFKSAVYLNLHTSFKFMTLYWISFAYRIGFVTLINL